MIQKDLTVGVACGLAVGMTLGLMVGAMAGMLFAPASGAEMRRRMRYERDFAAEAARSQVRRTMTRLHLAKMNIQEGEEGEEGEKEEEVGAFSGA
jgi:gas vesicle protein